MRSGASRSGDRLINEHDQCTEHRLCRRSSVSCRRGRATFKLNSFKRIDAPHGTLVFAPPEVRADSGRRGPGTTLVRSAELRTTYSPRQRDLDPAPPPLISQYHEAANQGRETIEATVRILQHGSATSRAAGASPNRPARHDRATPARAIDGNEPFRWLPAGGSDFDPIQQDQRFEGLVSGSASEPAVRAPPRAPRFPSADGSTRRSSPIMLVWRRRAACAT